MKLYFHPDVSDGLVLEERPDVRWVVEVPLTSNAIKPFRGDASLLQPIAAFPLSEPGQLGVDVVGMVEIAERAGVSRDTVAKWRARHADFPGPMATLGAGPVWSWEAVERWLRITREPGRPTPDRLASRAWDAASAALPPGWHVHLVAGLDLPTAEAAGPSHADRVRASGQSVADALFALSADLRRRAQLASLS